MQSLMQEMDNVENEDDPRVMGEMMRRFSELSGLEMGEKMEDFVAKLEAGLDPESLENEMDNELGDDDDPSDLFKVRQVLGRRKKRPPRIDDELYYFE